MKTKLSLKEINDIKKNEWVILSTSKENMPHSIIVLPSRVESDKIILSNIQMETTIDNITINPNCFINVYIKEKNDKQIKIDCTAKVYSDGELFKEIKEYEETNNLPEDLKVKSIIVAYIEKVEISEG